MTIVFYVSGLTAVRDKNGDNVKVLVQLLSEKYPEQIGQCSLTVSLEAGARLNIGSRFTLEQIHSGGLENGSPIPESPLP